MSTLDFSGMNTNYLFGMKLVVHHGVVPKRTLSLDVPVSPEFRVQVNAWMLEFFGAEPIIPDGVVYMRGDRDFIGNPKTIAAIKAALPEGVNA